MMKRTCDLFLNFQESKRRPSDLRPSFILSRDSWRSHDRRYPAWVPSPRACSSAWSSQKHPRVVVVVQPMDPLGVTTVPEPDPGTLIVGTILARNDSAARPPSPLERISVRSSSLPRFRSLGLRIRELTMLITFASPVVVIEVQTDQRQQGGDLLRLVDRSPPSHGRDPSLARCTAYDRGARSPKPRKNWRAPGPTESAESAGCGAGGVLGQVDQPRAVYRSCERICH